jgi:hypothetical protein
MLILTDADILADIIAYEDRIGDAQEKLDALPADADTWKEKKKLKEKRRALGDEIRHVRNLINIAEEALS